MLQLATLQLQRVEQALWRWLLQGTQPALSLAVVGPSGSQQHLPVAVDAQSLMSWSILWGVPVSKTSRARVRTRRYGHTRILHAKANLVNCQNCGAEHELHSICGVCYDKVRRLTNQIKEKMMLAYDPYDGQMPDREAKVVFEGEPEPEDDSQQVIKLEQQRPAWFSDALTAKWHNKKK